MNIRTMELGEVAHWGRVRTCAPIVCIAVEPVYLWWDPLGGKVMQEGGGWIEDSEMWHWPENTCSMLEKA